MTKFVCFLVILLLVMVIGNHDNVRFIAYGVVDKYTRDDFAARFVFGSRTSAYQVLPPPIFIISKQTKNLILRYVQLMQV